MHHDGPASSPLRDRLGLLLTSLRLFVSSYTPLFAIMTVKAWGTTAGWAFAILTAAGLAETIALVAFGRRSSGYPIDIVNIRDAGAEISAYVATYLLPFVWGDISSVRDMLAIAIFFMVILSIGHRGHLHHINPTLYILGRKVVLATTATGRKAYLVCRESPEPGRVRVSDLHGVYILK